MTALSAAERTQRYDVPLGHLEYDYIRKCKDVKEVEKIVKVLRSGDEGKYPDLEEFAEKRLHELNPNSKVLRKQIPVSTPRDIEKSEWDKIAGDLENWTSEIKSAEEAIIGSKTQTGEAVDADLPPVRGQGQSIPTQKPPQEDAAKESETSKKKNKKRVKPRDYREWDKFDIDAELAKAEGESEKMAEKGQEETSKPTTSNVLRKSSKPAIPDRVDSTGLTEQEKTTKATSEKEKGNEAFRAGDYEEALLYYCRSLSLAPTVAAFNNRAQAYLKLEDWDKALADCQTVLSREPGNLKGVLRRSVAYKGKKQYTNAKNDLQKVLSADPGNKRAQDLLKEVETQIEEQKVKGRRMVIEESDGSDSEGESRGKPGGTDTPEVQTLVNGVHEVPVQNQNEPKESPLPGHNSKNIWEEDDLKKSEESEASTNLSETSQKQHESKPSNKSSPTENKNTAGTTAKTEGSSSQSKSGKGNKKKKKGKGSGKNQSNQQNTKNVEPVESVEKTKNPNVSSPAPTPEPAPVSDGGLATAAEAESSTGSTPKQAATTENVTPIPQVVQPPPQKPLPANVTRMKTAGNDLFKTGQYGEAIGHYDQGIDVLRKDKVGHGANLAVLYSNRAACKLKVGDCEGCVRDCNESLQLQPGSVKPLTRRAQAYEAMEKYRRAYMDFRQVLYVDSSVDVAMQGVNRCMKVLQQTDGPKWREKLPVVNMSGLTSSAPPTSVTPVTTPADAPPTHPPQSQATPPEAAPAPQKTLTKEELFEKHKSEGNGFVQKGEYALAVTCYSQCIATLPNNSAPYTNRALCNLRLNKPDQVISDCNTALELEADNIKALFRRAQAYKMLERYDESFHDLACLLKKDPKNTSARREFQVVINYREEAKKARQAAEKAEKEKEKEKEKAEKPTTAPAKQRKRIQIQEVSSDSEEEESLKAKAPSTTNADKSKSASVSSKQPQQPTKTKSQKKGKAAKSEVKNTKTEDTPAKSEAKSEKSNTKPAKSQEDSLSPGDKSEDKPAKSDTKSKKPSETEKENSNTEKVKSPSKDDVSSPELLKRTPYEFIQAWTALKTTKQTERYAKLLEQIEPEELPKVISNKLDGDMLHMIIKCVDLLLDQGLFSRSFAYLQQLTMVPRFSMITMFMGGKEKKDLKRVLHKLSAGASCEYLQEDLAKLRKAYDV